MTDDETDDARMSAAAEYALGLLSSAEAQAFEAEMQRNPELRDELAEWTEYFVTLTNDIPPVTPPAGTYDAITARLFGAPKARFSLWSVLAGAVTAAALAAAVMVLMLPAPNPADNDLIAGLASDDDALRLTAVFDPDTDILHVQRVAGGPVAGRALELWLIAGDAAPVSLGLVPVEADGRLNVPAELAAQIAGGILAVSDEPEGGSTTGAPTGDVLAVAPFSNV